MVSAENSSTDQLYYHLVQHNKQFQSKKFSSTDSKVRLALYSVLIPEESTAQQFSFEWLDFRISSTDSKVKTTLCSMINSTTAKYCSIAFIYIITPQDFIHRLKRQNHLIQRAKQYHRKYCSVAFISWLHYTISSMTREHCMSQNKTFLQGSSARTTRAPYLRKFANLSIRKNLVIT